MSYAWDSKSGLGMQEKLSQQAQSPEFDAQNYRKANKTMHTYSLSTEGK